MKFSSYFLWLKLQQHNFYISLQSQKSSNFIAPYCHKIQHQDCPLYFLCVNFWFIFKWTFSRPMSAFTYIVWLLFVIKMSTIETYTPGENIIHHWQQKEKGTGKFSMLKKNNYFKVGTSKGCVRLEGKFTTSDQIWRINKHRSNM